MYAVWRALLWKEWREHHGKLIAIVVILAATWFFAASHQGAWFDALIPCVFIIAGATGNFVGLGVASGENSRNTRTFIEVQPQPLWKLATAKVLAGGLAVVLPGLVFALFIWLFTLFSDRLSLVSIPLPHTLPGWADSWWQFVLVIYPAITLSLFLWTAAIAANARDEIRAAMYSIGLMVVWWIAVGLMMATHQTAPPLAEFLWSVGPLGFFSEGSYAIQLSLLIHVFVTLMYIWRFARSTENTSNDYSPRPIAILRRAWLAPPFKRRWQALLWKTLREAAPLVICGVVGAALLSLFFIVVQRMNDSVDGTTTNINDFAYGLLFCTSLFAFFVAIMCGIAVVWSDIQPGINSFWRSRPCSPDAWFWIKYVGSLLLIVFAFGLPILASAYLGADRLLIRDGQSLVHAAASALLGFAIAVLATSVLRNAVYASILAIGGAMAAFSTITGPQQDDSIWWFPTVVVTVSAVVASVASWLAFRFDWSLADAHD